MAADLATLVIQVVTTSLDAASSKLKGVEDASKKTETAISKLAKALEVAAAALAAYKLGDLARDAALLAARYETLGVVMNTVGKNAGYSAQAMDYYARALEKTGISMVESRSNITKLVQAHLDLTQATQLARAAQDAAVIANINSSEAFASMVHAIQSGQSDILRNMGIAVNWEQAYRNFAKTLGTVPDALTETEKTQARANAVMLASAANVGVYEASMDTAAKQIQSFKRYLQDFQVEAGKAFGPALTDIVKHATGYIKNLTEAIKSQEAQDRLAGLGDTARKTFDSIVTIGGQMGTLFNAALDGWNSLPLIIQEVGLIGALFGGMKAKALIFGGLAVLDNVKTSMQGLLAAARGDIDWTDLGLDDAALKAKLTSVGGALPAGTSTRSTTQSDLDALEKRTQAIINATPTVPLVASWYGPGFAGRPTASGQTFDPSALTVASKNYDLGTVLQLLYTGKDASGKDRTNRVYATVNDRGPYVDGRDIDLSEGTAAALTKGMAQSFRDLGVFKVSAVPQTQDQVANLYGEAQTSFDALGKPNSPAYLEAQLSKRAASMQRLVGLMRMYATDDQSKQMADLYQGSIADAVMDEKRGIFGQLMAKEERLKAPMDAMKDMGRKAIDALYDGMAEDATLRGDLLAAVKIQTDKQWLDFTSELEKEWMATWNKMREAEYVGDDKGSANWKAALGALNDYRDAFEANLAKEKERKELLAQATIFSRQASHDAAMADLTGGRAVNIDYAKREQLWSQMLQSGTQAGNWQMAGDEFHAAVAKMVKDHEDATRQINQQWAQAYGTRADQYAAETALVQEEYRKQLAAAGESQEQILAVERLYAEKRAEAKARSEGDWVAGAQKGLREYANSAEDVFSGVEQMGTNTFSTLEGVLVNAPRKGALAFSDMADSIISDLMRIVVRAQITGPLASALMSGLGSVFGGAAAPSTAGGSTGAAMGFTRSYGFHEGGIVGLEPTFIRSLPRYHSGGIAGDEVPAILRRGEGVFTPGQMAAMGSRAPTVEVHVHNAPAGTRVERSQTSGGGERVDVWLGRFVDDRVRSSMDRGAFDAGMESRFGVRRQGRI